MGQPRQPSSFDGQQNHGSQPEATDRTAEDDAILATVDSLLAASGEQLERVELRSALRSAMEGAQAVNAYLNATEPWKLAKSDADRSAVVLATALDAVNGIRIAFTPFLPFSSAHLDAVLGEVDGWRREPVAPGTVIEKPTPLFVKVDVDELLAAMEQDSAD